MIKAEDNITLKSTKSIYDIADNTAQYFWVTTEGDDTGAHITEVDKETFLNDPDNGGGNLLARSNGIAIRDGLKEVASFTKDRVHLGYVSSLNSFAGAEITTSSIKFKPLFGSVPFRFDVTDAGVEITQRLTGTGGAVSTHVLSADGGYTVTVDGVVTTGNYRVLIPRSEFFGTLYFTSSYPAEGAEIVITYTALRGVPIYQFGIGEATSPFGVVEGLMCTASGVFSHAQNLGTKASGEAQTAIGKYNVENEEYAFIIGNGGDGTESNAVAIDWKGNIRLAGSLYVGCDSDSSNGVVLAVSRYTIPASSSKSITLERGKFYKVTTAQVPASMKGEYIVSVSSAGTVGSASVRNASDIAISGSSATMTIANNNASYAVQVRIEEI